MMKILILLLAFIHAINGSKSFCPSLARRINYWNIEKLLVSWSGIEFFEHHSKEVVREECLSLEILQVNEFGEEITMGQASDPYNHRLSIAYLKLIYETPNDVSEQIVSYNNTLPALWRGKDKEIIQVVKADTTQLMLTFCQPNQQQLYTILFAKKAITEATADSTQINRLILQARNLKIRSNTKVQTDCSKSSSANVLEINTILSLFMAFLFYWHNKIF